MLCKTETLVAPHKEVDITVFQSKSPPPPLAIFSDFKGGDLERGGGFGLKYCDEDLLRRIWGRSGRWGWKAGDWLQFGFYTFTMGLGYPKYKCGKFETCFNKMFNFLKFFHHFSDFFFKDFEIRAARNDQIWYIANLEKKQNSPFWNVFLLKNFKILAENMRKVIEKWNKNWKISQTCFKLLTNVFWGIPNPSWNLKP